MSCCRDVWGVTHNGVAAFPEACDALARFRAGGGTVILLTNAPRRGEAVLHQLDQLGVPRDAYDGIVSSGDVTCGVMAERPGQSVFHLGPQRDISIFEGLNVRFASAEEADYVVCTGLFNDETETPEILSRDARRSCATADCSWCAAIRMWWSIAATRWSIAPARSPTFMGRLAARCCMPASPMGRSMRLALAKATQTRGAKVETSRVLAIGDSVRTDLKGAATFGIDCLFVTAGIHAEELGGRHNPDMQILTRIFSEAGLEARAVTRTLVW